MLCHRVVYCLVACLMAGSVALSENASVQSSTTNPFRASFGWEHLPEGRVMGTVSGVHPDPDGQHLWILDRCGGNQCAGTDLDPIMKFDLDGNLVDSFGAGLFAFPHGFFLDHEGFLWVTEGGSHGDRRATLGESLGMGHQVVKLNQQGEVVYFPGLSGLHDQTGLGAVALANQVMMNRRSSQEAGYRGHAIVYPAVRQDDDGAPIRDRLGCLAPQPVDG